VSSVAITSSSEQVYSQLNAGDNVSVTATFSESVIVTDDDGIGVDNASGTPTLTIVVGSTNRTATYVSGSASTALVFQYTIQSAETDTNGISIGTDSLALNSGTIRDASGNYATITHSSVAANSSYKVNTAVPTVSAVLITSSTSNTDTSEYIMPYSGASQGSLCDGRVVGSECYIYVTATFSEIVTVTGSPRLSLYDAEGTSRTATYASGSGSTQLPVFRYAILIGDPDSNGISIIENALTLNSGTIKDLAGNDATITHSSVAVNGSYKVKEN
jgi:hypothetical protein